MDDHTFLLTEKYGGVVSPAYEADVVRLKNGEPLAYVIGWIPFLECKIFLDSKPLIPRPETEYWTEMAITEIAQKPAPRVLDLFAGSGAIGVAVAKHVPDSQVTFGEIDETHFPTIRKNILENKITGLQTHIVKTDVYSALKEAYDFILANPPYISKNRRERVQESVIRHEPELALFADEDGFALIQRLILGAPKHLAPQGVLFIEHEPEQAENIQKAAREAKLDVELHKDQYGVVRFSRLSVMA